MTKEEAIKIFQHKIETMERGAICCDYGIDKDAFALAIQALKQESRTGHWIYVGDRVPWYRCSECRRRVRGGHHKYCPNCGTKMESGAE